MGFADSDEYRLIRIGNAYRTILGREPEAGGRAIGGFTTITFAFDRGYVVQAIYSAVEAARSRISVMYSTSFGRTPDESGVANWATYDLANGDAATRSGLTSSDEYYFLAAVRYP